ncbi:MAG: hypothetical protein IKA02_04340 [Clostridia bacterium]|nr:hypothetical protein [Clostridia bacterium]
MTGKANCERLKRYRNKLAEVNGIDFKAKECDFQGECPGFCPACDEEILFLEKALKEKARRGESIAYQGLIHIAFKNGDKVYDFKPSEYRTMMGKIVHRDDETEPKENEKTDEEFEKEINRLIKRLSVENGETEVDESDDTLMGDIIPDDTNGDW